MNENTTKAMNILKSENVSLVLVKGDEILKFTCEPLKALLSECEGGKDYYGFSCAIKNAGRASSFLCVYLELSEVYAQNLLKGAVNVLDRAEISYFTENLSENLASDETFLKAEEAVIRSGSAVSALSDIRRIFS